MNYRKLFSKAVEHWPAKVLSLGLAIILFVFHSMSTLEERFFSVPLSVEQTGALMPSSSYPRMIRVTLKGEANSIFPIQESDVEVYVNMNKYSVPGTYSVPIRWRKKGTAQGVEPLQISVDPMEISLSLDQKISKFVPLAASLRGQVEMGHAMTSYSLNPAQVIIDGPSALMAGIAELYTDDIDLDGRRDNFSVTVNILNRDPLIIIRGNGTAEFHGNISQIIPVRNIENVPIVISGLPEGYSAAAEPETGSIHLEGENQDAVNRFEAPPDFLTVDCSGVTEPGTYVLRVTGGTVPGATFRIEPEEVTVEITEAPEESEP